MTCPRCNGRMFFEAHIDGDERTWTCLACGYEDYPRLTVSLEQAYAELKSENRSIGSTKRPAPVGLA